MSWRGPEHQNLQVLFDRPEPVLRTGPHEGDRSGPDLPVLVAHPQLGSARGDVVHLVLGVRSLLVRSAGRPEGDGQAQRLRSKELGEVVPGRVEPLDLGVEVERIHDVNRLNRLR